MGGSSSKKGGGDAADPAAKWDKPNPIAVRASLAMSTALTPHRRLQTTQTFDTTMGTFKAEIYTDRVPWPAKVFGFACRRNYTTFWART